MLAVRLTSAKLVKKVKQSLESRGLLDKKNKIVKESNGSFLIYTLCSNEVILEAVLTGDGDGESQSAFEIIPIKDNPDTPASSDSTSIIIHQIFDNISSHTPVDTNKISQVTTIFSRKKWSIYPPLILFTAGTGLNELNLPPYFFEQILLKQSFFFGRKEITHIAENAPIPESDRVRRPSDLIPIYGNFGPDPNSVSNYPTSQDFQNAFWCSTIQNGIYQTWAPRYTMFSRGNITEKARVLHKFQEQAPIQGTTVVDMYAGIGYFTFSYARNKPSRILCWELNPWSVEGLIRGAHANNWPVRLVHDNESYNPLTSDFIVVFLEDNAKALNRISQAQISNISHINLGLLPDSRLAWSDSLQIGLSNSSLSHPSVLHIHENISASITDTWPDTVSANLHNQVEFLYLELIKTFAPGVYHVCGDFRVVKH